MKCAKEAQSEASSECMGRLFLNRNASVVQEKLVNALLEMLEVPLINRKGSDEDHGLWLFETRQWLNLPLKTNFGICVTNFRFLTAPHARVEVDVPNLACPKNFLWCLIRKHNSDFAHCVLEPGRERDNLIASSNCAIKNPHEQDHALVRRIPGINKEKSKRFCVIPHRCRYPVDHSGKKSLYVESRLCRNKHG